MLLRYTWAFPITVCAGLFIASHGHTGPRVAERQAVRKPRTVVELLKSERSAISTWRDYVVTGATEADGKTQRFRLAFKQPHFVRIDTRDGQVSVQPDGSIRGRLGHGLFGSISRRLDRTDRRLRDSEGIPCYESDFASILDRIDAQIKAGAAAAVTAEQSDYMLAVSAGNTTWKYWFRQLDGSVRANGRWVGGAQAELTRYTGFRANTGLKLDDFRF